MIADVKTQATTLTRWARAILSARVKLCMGRECGRVLAVAAGVAGVEIGSRVVAKWRPSSKGGRGASARDEGSAVGG